MTTDTHSALQLLYRLSRWIHCLVWWHHPVDGMDYLWCGDCGRRWPSQGDNE